MQTARAFNIGIEIRILTLGAYIIDSLLVSYLNIFIYIIYSALLSDSIISILSNLLYIAKFTTAENNNVSKIEYKK